MLRINLEWDPNALAAPQSFRDGVQQAAAILEAAIYDPITINIEVGYGEYDQTLQLNFGDSEGGVQNTVPVSYPALRAALASKASTATDVKTVDALPATASLDGQSTFYISTGLAKALGAVDPNATAIDGYIGFPTSFTGAGLVGTAVTEELHAMGLLNDAGDLGLFAYTSPGDHFLPTGPTSSTAAYFSVDGGTTDLANYNVTNDDTLFQSQPNDPLDYPNEGTALTQLDLTEISAIGFDVTSTPVLATPDVIPTRAAPGSTITVSANNVSVAEGHSVAALAFVSGVSVPSDSNLAAFSFKDSGSDGHFTLDGAVEPDGQSFVVLDTQLKDLAYVGGSTPGSDTIQIAALDDAPSYSYQVAYATATTTQATAASIPDSNFYGAGDSDLLLQDASGDVAGWQVDGSALGASALLGTPGAGLHAIATGDFDGDGKSDILLQDDDGTVAVWTMNGLAVAAAADVADPGPSWHAMGAGDFNGDGKSDIVLQNDDGTVAVWTVDGASIRSSAVVADPGPGWRVAGTGDFDGDGKSDILLQNDDGTVAVWTMNGAAIRSSAVVADPGPGWRVAGTGDFDGDGKSDILLQNDDSTVAVWTMNGTAVRSFGVVADPGPGWHAVATGDFNGDGKADIALQNDDGSVALWDMSGASLAGAAVVADPGASWQLIGQGGIHFIDGTQTTGTVQGTIGSDDFVFTSFEPGAHTIAGFDPAHDAVTLSQARFPSYAAVQGYETQGPGGVVIDLGSGSSLTLAGVTAAGLSAKNFL